MIFIYVYMYFFAIDNQTEEQPTFILTLYEIPTSQLFDQDMSAYELQPAEVHTPHLFSSDALLSTLVDSRYILELFCLDKNIVLECLLNTNQCISLNCLLQCTAAHEFRRD